MKLIPNIQKELDALMADPLNYQDPNGILLDKDHWHLQIRSVSDAFILLEASDFEIADKLIASHVKTERGKKLRDAYASVSQALSEGKYEELEVGRGTYDDHITPYYDRFIRNLQSSINYRRRWNNRIYYSDIESLFPALTDLTRLEEDLLDYANDYRKAAIHNYRRQQKFEKALSNSADCLQPFV